MVATMVRLKMLPKDNYPLTTLVVLSLFVGNVTLVVQMDGRYIP
jgi:hypothetical protein